MSAKNKRTGEKAACTKAANDLNSELNKVAPDKECVESLISIVEKKMDKIEGYTDSIIDSMTDESQIIDEKTRELEYESKINLVLTGAKSYLKNVQSSLSGFSMSSNRDVKLPKLSLIKFDDTILGWPAFWDSFYNSVDKRRDLSSSQKFTYLKGLLQGDSLMIVDKLTIDNASYSVAVKLLKDTYDNKVVGIMNQVDILQNLNVKDYTLHEVRSFRAKFESIVASLENLSCKVMNNSSAETLIICSILSKLPKVMQDNMRRSAGDDIIKLSKFREVLKTEMELLSNNEDSVSNNSKLDSDITTAGSFALTSNNKPGKPNDLKYEKSNSKPNSQGKGSKNKKGQSVSTQSYCHFCDVTGHSSGSCSVYSDTNSRLARLSTLPNRCKLCWFRSHGNQPCIKLVCRVCKQNHWTAICTNLKQIPCTSVSTYQIGSANSVALPTVTVPYFDSNSNRHILRCLIDQCSQRTLILRSIVSRFSIPSNRQEYISISGFGGTQSGKYYDIIDINVGYPNDLIKFSAVVVDELPRIVIDNIESIAKDMKYRGISLADSNLTSSYINDISLLIGNDHYYKFVCIDQLPEIVNNVVLLPTKFGKAISGPIPGSHSNNNVNVVSVLKIGVSPLPWRGEVLPRENDNIDKLWLIDNIGITDDSNAETDIEVLNNFNKSIVYDHNNNQYNVSFPWRSNLINLPSNYALARGRLVSLLRRLDNDPELLKHYDTVIQDQISKGFVEKVPGNEIKNPNAHYLPHHPVVRDHPTTPVRIVMDCSAKIKGCASLNDCLSVGPSLVPLLVEIILRLRLTRYICSGDISKAFLRIGLSPEDRDRTRFFWRDNYDDPNSKINVFRFKRVLFGSSSSPFLLQATVKHHLERFGAEDLGRNLYVDNLHAGFNDEQELIKFYERSMFIFNKAGLPLREWFSNSDLFNGRVAKDGCSPDSFCNDLKILGIRWNLEKDFFHIEVPTFSGGIATKRSILSDAGRIFDPLGVLVPVTITVRVFLQNLWKLKYDWDVPLGDDLQKDWGTVLKKLDDLKNVEIPRWIVKSSVVSLHLFSDSSRDIYGSCAYIVDNNSSNLLMAKARVAPIKALTIPKLELLSALLSSRLVTFILNTYKLELKFESIHLWIDNQAVLSWLISSNESKNLFIRNRIQEIKTKIPFAHFHYISTDSNPADLITKFGINDINNCEFWWHGPQLLLKRDQWIDWNSTGDFSIEQDSVVVNATAVDIECYNNYFPDPFRFSKWNRLLNATCYVKRFINIVTKKDVVNGPISIVELDQSKKLLINEIQLKWYQEELRFLENHDKFTGKTPQLVKNLWLVLHSGLIRVNTRLEYSILDYDERFPILLPPKDYVTHLVIQFIHENNFHSSVSVTMSSLRLQYWIPQCRRIVSKVISDCKMCKRNNIQRYKIPFTPPLPSFRVNDCRPFQFCGVDLTGALYIKNGSVIKKVYMVLFTCASSRAVHLEIAENLSADAFSRVYRRFTSRRSSPQLMLSDNATNFVGFQSQLKEFQGQQVLTDMLQKSNTEWRFIPARAPWFGGMWERLIGICKRIIKKALGNKLISYDELQTIVVEVEGKVNSRPLTYFSSHSEDCVPLTPSHLLHGHRLDSLPHNVNVDLDENYEFNSPAILNKRHKHVLTILKEAASLWRKEYILALRERDRKVKPINIDGDIIPSVGDVVNIIDNNDTNTWKLGRIVSLHKGSDGEIRVAKLSTKYGLMDRSLTKLSHLESIEKVIPSQDVDNDDNVSVVSPSVELNLKPKRTAAVGAQSKITGWAQAGLV